MTNITKAEQDAIDAWNTWYDESENTIDLSSLTDEEKDEMGLDHDGKPISSLFEEEMWGSMAIGFLLGRGVSPARAYAFVYALDDIVHR